MSPAGGSIQLASGLQSLVAMQKIETLDLAQVTGGAGKLLKARKIGNVKLIGNQSLKDMFWEVKPF